MPLVIALAALPAVYVAVTSNSSGVDSFETNTTDALVFRSAAELLWMGQSPYDTDLQQRHIGQTRLGGDTPPYYLPFAYPPNALPLLMVYLAGPPHVALVLSVFVGTVLMLATTYGLAGLFCRHPLDRMLTVLGTGLGGAVLFNARLGQTGTCLAATLFAYVVCYRRAPIRAGVALGLMAFKPQYALLLGVVALMERRWRTAVSSALTFLSCCALSGLLFGFKQWTSFYEAVLSFNRTIPFMCNWYAPARKLLPGAESALHDAGMVVMLVGVLALGVYCLVDRGGGNRSLRHLAVATALAPLVSPNTHPYDLIIWILPVCLAARRTRWLSTWLAVSLAGMVLAALLALHLRWLLPVASATLAIAAAMPLSDKRAPLTAVSR